MSDHATDLKAQIAGRIRATPEAVWTPVDFLDLGSREAVDKTLQRLTHIDQIRRLDRGLYDRPRRNRLTGQMTIPDYRQVIEAVARRDQSRMLVDGMTAANDLGLSRRGARPDRRAHGRAVAPHQARQANHRLPPDGAQQAVLGRPAGHAGCPGTALATPLLG